MFWPGLAPAKRVVSWREGPLGRGAEEPFKVSFFQGVHKADRGEANAPGSAAWSSLAGRDESKKNCTPLGDRFPAPRLLGLFGGMAVDRRLCFLWLKKLYLLGCRGFMTFSTLASWWAAEKSLKNCIGPRAHEKPCASDNHPEFRAKGPLFSVAVDVACWLQYLWQEPISSYLLSPKRPALSPQDRPFHF